MRLLSEISQPCILWYCYASTTGKGKGVKDSYYNWEGEGVKATITGKGKGVKDSYYNSQLAAASA